MVFRIEEDYTSREFYVCLPELNGRMEPNLVVCGSSLVLITQDSRQLCLCLWELEFESNLNITSNPNPSWKLISQMPPDVMGFLNSGKHLLFDSLSKHRFLTMRNYICILTEGNGRLAFFNKEDGSWSYWGVDDSRKNITTTIDAHLCDPSLINLESMTNVLGARRGARI